MHNRVQMMAAIAENMDVFMHVSEASWSSVEEREKRNFKFRHFQFLTVAMFKKNNFEIWNTRVDLSSKLQIRKIIEHSFSKFTKFFVIDLSFLWVLGREVEER